LFANLKKKSQIIFVLLSFALQLFTTEAFASLEVGVSNPISARATPALHSPQVQSRFINTCRARGIREQFCRQITSPNTNSAGTFRAVYGSQPFVLMPPESSWDRGIYLLTVAESLAEFGEICEIRNWYRPEPYNAAVSGAQGSQHLSAGAIDIEFCTAADKNRALRAALAMRQRFQSPPGVGVYGEGSLVIHVDMSNRIYGPGIAYADRAAATESVWATVSRPGTNLSPNSSLMSNASGTRSSRPRTRPSTTPAAQRQSVNDFFRQILAIFTTRST
jgi:hypothetical protein